MTRKNSWWQVPALIGLSLAISLGSYLWLSRLDVSKVFLVIVPAATFVSAFLAGWLALNLARTFVFHNQGVQGYKLRGRITFFFILTNTVSLLLVGGVLFVMILFIENSIIDKEKGIADEIVESYKEVIIRDRKEFERKLEASLLSDKREFGTVFSFQSDRLTVIKSGDRAITELLEKYSSSIRNYFATSSKRFFYPGDVNLVAVARQGTVFYAAAVPEFLRTAFQRTKHHMDELFGLRILKNYIRPASIAIILSLSVPILIAVFFVSIALARSISQNLEKIARGTNIIAMGNLDYRVNIKSRDEIEDLAANFNAMAEKLKMATGQIKRMERLEAWKEMARRLAHEIKNPLTPIRLSAERLQYSWNSKPGDFEAILVKTTNTIVNETRRLENLVNEFSQFARLPDPKIEKTDIAAVLREISDLMQSGPEDVPLISDIPPGSVIAEVDGNQMKQVFINLVKNAREASRAKPAPVTLELRSNSFSFRVKVRDQGPGIPIEIQERIFEPYFSTKDNGSGLGLAIVERIVMEHGGYLGFETGAGGTEFSIEIPLARIPLAKKQEDTTP